MEQNPNKISKRDEFNQDITIVGLTFILLIAIAVYVQSINRLYQTERELVEVKKIYIKIDQRLTKTEDKLEESKGKIQELHDRLGKFGYLEKLQKDIARVWDEATD